MGCCCSKQGSGHDSAMERLRAGAPEVMRAFGPFFQSLMKDGALPARTKELIALGISVATHCEPCIESHVGKCLKAGATEGEIVEAAGVAVVMGGGPAYTHVPLVIKALERHEDHQHHEHHAAEPAPTQITTSS